MWGDISNGYLADGLRNAPERVDAFAASLRDAVVEGQQIAAEAAVAGPHEKEALMERYVAIASKIDEYFYLIGG